MSTKRSAIHSAHDVLSRGCEQIAQFKRGFACFSDFVDALNDLRAKWERIRFDCEQGGLETSTLSHDTVARYMAMLATVDDQAHEFMDTVTTSVFPKWAAACAALGIVDTDEPSSEFLFVTDTRVSDISAARTAIEQTYQKLNMAENTRAMLLEILGDAIPIARYCKGFSVRPRSTVPFSPEMALRWVSMVGADLNLGEHHTQEIRDNCMARMQKVRDACRKFGLECK